MKEQILREILKEMSVDELMSIPEIKDATLKHFQDEIQRRTYSTIFLYKDAAVKIEYNLCVDEITTIPLVTGDNWDTLISFVSRLGCNLGEYIISNDGEHKEFLEEE